MEELPRLDAKPERLSQLVYEAIRDAIIAKTLPPGDPVSEARLARQLGVSKTPVREALLRLQAIGLVEPRSRGACVVTPSAELLRSSYEVRATLEAGVARLATLRATADQKAEIVGAAERSLQVAEADDISAFQSWDRRFHELMTEACGNPHLADLLRNASTLARVLRARDAPSQNHALRCAAYHLEIAAAVERGDADRASQCASEHIEFLLRFVKPEQETREQTVEDVLTGG